MLLVQQLLTYKNLILHISLTLTLSLLLSFLNLPVFFLHSLHTYIHPDHVPSCSRAAISRPDSADPSRPELRKRPKTKSNNKASSSPFDESNAQIFRLKLDGAHLLSRLFFSDSSFSLSLSAVALSSLSLHLYLSHADVTAPPPFIKAAFVPLLLSLTAVANLIAVLAKLSAEISSSRKSEKQLTALFGVVGLVGASLLCFKYSPDVLDFEFSDDVSGRVVVAVVMGCLAGFMFMPGAKSGRAFWLGTDQARLGLSMMSCEWFGKVALYASHAMVLFTVALWINPLGGLLVKTKNENVGGNVVGNREGLLGNVGFSHEDFAEFRIWCLLVSGFVQLVAVRPSLQMYLNEALLCWYQRLHAGKVPDLEFSRAKVFLHNHYLCLAVLQFMTPPLMVLLFVGLSRMEGVSLEDYKYACSVLPCAVFVREVAVFFAWWILFVWAVYSSTTIFMYRRCVLYMS